jgi:hypothetical protein
MNLNDTDRECLLSPRQIFARRDGRHAHRSTQQAVRRVPSTAALHRLRDAVADPPTGRAVGLDLSQGGASPRVRRHGTDAHDGRNLGGRPQIPTLDDSRQEDR